MIAESSLSLEHFSYFWGFSSSSFNPISASFESERIFDLLRVWVFPNSDHFLFGNFLILHLFLFGWMSSLHLRFLSEGDRSLWIDSFYKFKFQCKYLFVDIFRVFLCIDFHKSLIVYLNFWISSWRKYENLV